MLRVPGRRLKEGSHKFQPKTQSRLPLGNHLPFLAPEEIWPLFSFSWEHQWGGKQLTGRGCSTAADWNAEIATTVGAGSPQHHVPVCAEDALHLLATPSYCVSCN